MQVTSSFRRSRAEKCVALHRIFKPVCELYGAAASADRLRGEGPAGGGDGEAGRRSGETGGRAHPPGGEGGGEVRRSCRD
jgi:hypothetical protein